MRVTEKLLLRNNQKKNKKMGASLEEETMIYKQKERWHSINDSNKSTFASTMEQGINKRESVFDRKATFHSKNNRIGRNV